MRKLVLFAAAAAVAVGIAVPLALASGSASTVKITEKEFKITPLPTSAKAGKVTFKIKNAGALDHTFDVFKTSLSASKLPVKNDRVTLKPGKYVLLCNISGHYKAGQRIAFTVK